MNEEQTPVNVCNNTFQGIVWDAKAIETVQTVAQALLNLTELFQSQNIQIDSLLKINTKEGETQL